MLLSVLLWTLMIQSTSLVYRGTLRLVVSQGCFPPIGPWTYTTTDTSLVSRDMKGPSLWGSSPLGGSGGQRCPEPFYIHHCSPSPSGVAVLPALCTIHLTYWEHITVSQSSYLLSARHISPFDFVSSSVSIAACFSMSLSRNHLTHQGMLISPCAHSLLNCTGISYPKAARGDPNWALSYIRLII
jgi:hypothetical protein